MPTSSWRNSEWRPRASILRDLQQGMWMISLDLKEAYLYVSIIPQHRKFLRFALKDQHGILCVYQWRMLPFGLATAPRVFTELLAPIAAHLHLRNMSMYPYIDDIFHAQISRESVIMTQDTSVHLHLQLGFVINLAKSSLIPSQVMTHLGAWIDTLNGLVRPSLDKVQEINQVSANLLANGFVSAGCLQNIVGLMAACHATVPLCLVRLRPLSSHLSRNFKWRLDPSKKIISLDVPEVVEALQFWSDPSRVAEGVPLGYQPSGQTLTTESAGRPARASSSSAKRHKQSSRSSSPGSKYPPPSRLASLGETLRAEGVSAAAACIICTGKRQSTRDLYDTKWRNFCGWCAEYGFDSLHPTPQQAVEYLEHLYLRN